MVNGVDDNNRPIDETQEPHDEHEMNNVAPGMEGNDAGAGLHDETINGGDSVGAGHNQQDPLLGTEEQDGRNDGTSTEGGVQGMNERDDVTGLTDEERREAR